MTRVASARRPFDRALLRIEVLDATFELVHRRGSPLFQPDGRRPGLLQPLITHGHRGDEGLLDCLLPRIEIMETPFELRRRFDALVFQPADRFLSLR